MLDQLNSIKKLLTPTAEAKSDCLKETLRPEKLVELITGKVIFELKSSNKIFNIHKYELLKSGLTKIISKDNLTFSIISSF